METPAGTNGPIDPDELHPQTDAPRYTPLEQLVLAAAPIAELTRVIVEGIQATPPEIFPAQATYVQERSNVITLDGSGAGPIHLISITVPVHLAIALQKALSAARGTKLVEGLVAKCGDPQLGARVQVHRPNAGAQG